MNERETSPEPLRAAPSRNCTKRCNQGSIIRHLKFRVTSLLGKTKHGPSTPLSTRGQGKAPQSLQGNSKKKHIQQIFDSPFQTTKGSLWLPC